MESSKSKLGKFLEGLRNGLLKLASRFNFHFALILVSPSGNVKKLSSHLLEKFTNTHIDENTVRAEWYLAKVKHAGRQRVLQSQPPPAIETYSKADLRKLVMGLVQGAVKGLKRR